MGERKSESVGKAGWVEWGDGEGLQRAGGEIERRWRNGEWQTGRWMTDNTVDMCWSEMHFSNVDFMTWSLIKVWYGLVTLIFDMWCIQIRDWWVKAFEIHINGQEWPQMNRVKFISLLMYVCTSVSFIFFLPFWKTQFIFSPYLLNHHLLLLMGAGQYDKLWNLTGLVGITPSQIALLHL